MHINGIQYNCKMQELHMIIAIWISAVVLSVPLAYSLRFTEATLSLGRALDEVSSGTGYQAAISPPREVAFSLVLYGLVVALLGYSWYAFGFGKAAITLMIILVGVVVFQRFMPHPQSLHYKRLIISSMAARYANFVRDGDPVRAAAMKTLLEKAGVPPEVFSS
jgi:hypothetical protein